MIIEFKHSGIVEFDAPVKIHLNIETVNSEMVKETSGPEENHLPFTSKLISFLA